MKLTKLIGQEIIDIRIRTQPNDDVRWLWNADCYLVFTGGLTIGIPFNLDGEEVWIREPDPLAVSIYHRKWWQRKVNARDDLRGLMITDIIYYPEGDNKVLLELNSGKIITEVTVAPIGIAVGLYVYDSLHQVEKNFGTAYIRLTTYTGNA